MRRREVIQREGGTIVWQPEREVYHVIRARHLRMDDNMWQLIRAVEDSLASGKDPVVAAALWEEKQWGMQNSTATTQ